jgi:predicted P-loop ATPase
MSTSITTIKQVKQWINWTADKIPCDATGRAISVTDTSKYQTYHEAKQNLQSNSSLKGIGFVFTESSEYCGLDLDDCLNENGDINSPEVEKLLEGYTGMIEISPSGRGLKLIMEGKKPAGITQSKIQALGISSVEWYDKNRYFTVTENYWKGRDQISRVSELSSKLVPLFSQSNNTHRSGESRNGPKWSSDDTQAHSERMNHFGNDQSKADMSYVSSLAIDYPFDATMIDTKFRSSHFMRDKWDQKHSGDGKTYGQMTIEKVLKSQSIADYHQLKAYLRYYYEFKFNEVMQCYEFRSKRNNSDWIEMEDRHIHFILDDLRSRKSYNKIGTQLLYEVIGSPSVSSSYDPIFEYFSSLPKWDGHDHFADLLTCLDTSDQDLSRMILRKWLMGLVATILKENTVNHGILLLKGSQGLGKTSFLVRLLPNNMSKYIYTGTIREDSKDTQMLMSQNLIINMDEMANLYKKEASMIKELITKDKIQVRLPYGRTFKHLKRRASFAGSVNDAQFLSDLTGTRRFWVIDCKAIHWKNIPDMGKVYSQIIHWINNGEVWYMDATDQKLLEHHNTSYEIKAVEDDLIDEYVYANEEGRLTTTEVMQRLSSISDIPIHAMKLKTIGQLLRNKGFATVNSKGTIRYKVRVSMDSTVRQPISRLKLFS